MWLLKAWCVISWVITILLMIFSWYVYDHILLLLFFLHAVSLTLIVRVLKTLVKEPPLPPPPQPKIEPWNDL